MPQITGWYSPNGRKQAVKHIRRVRSKNGLMTSTYAGWIICCQECSAWRVGQPVSPCQYRHFYYNPEGCISAICSLSPPFQLVWWYISDNSNAQEACGGVFWSGKYAPPHPLLQCVTRLTNYELKKIKIIAILLGCDSNTDDDSSLLGCYVMSTAIKFFS